MKFQPLGPEDLDAALALSTAEGWNQTAADWERLVRLEPDGCFAAHDGGRLVGTVTTTTYGRELAWIGMMVVDPRLRRRGIGAILMSRALDHLRDLGIATVKLDATPAGRPLYESLGFVAESEIERWQGLARGTATDAQSVAPLETLAALDRAAFGVDRTRLLELLVTGSRGGPLVARADVDTVAGFALARPGRAATYIGPLIATTAGIALRLLDGMRARLAGEEVCLDLHRTALLPPSALIERGLSKRRGLLRMRFGPRADAEAGPALCASAGPEFG